MVVLPLLAMTFSLACTAVCGWDAFRRPKPERIAWTIAFLLFAVAAGSEVAGTLTGWTPTLARLFYLTGAVLVVGLLGLGELYLLFGARLPSITPGVTLLVVALAATIVWGARVDDARLVTAGWTAIEKSPVLVALAASINILGTLVLCGGALWSAWTMRSSPAMAHRAIGCALIAAGAVIVAMGGTLTRLGQREYLYIAMTVGIATIFIGILQTRHTARDAPLEETTRQAKDEMPEPEPRLTLLRSPFYDSARGTRGGEAARYILDVILPLDAAEMQQLALDWGATVDIRPPLTRLQATRVWRLRRDLPVKDQPRWDRLPLGLQAQIAELYAEVWSESAAGESDMRHA